MIVYPAYAYMGKKKPKQVLGFLGNADTYEKADWVVTYANQASRVSKERGVYQVTIKGASQYAKIFDLVNVASVRGDFKYLKFEYQKDAYAPFYVQINNGTTRLFADTNTDYVDGPVPVAVEVPAGTTSINFINSAGASNSGVYVNNIRFEN